MQASGLAAVESAKRDGRWEGLMILPVEPRCRYAILFRIQTAKKLETRTRRIQEFIAMPERGETIHP